MFHGKTCDVPVGNHRKSLYHQWTSKSFSLENQHVLIKLERSLFHGKFRMCRENMICLMETTTCFMGNHHGLIGDITFFHGQSPLFPCRYHRLDRTSCHISKHLRMGKNMQKA